MDHEPFDISSTGFLAACCFFGGDVPMYYDDVPR